MSFPVSTFDRSGFHSGDIPDCPMIPIEPVGKRRLILRFDDR
jgi:hypothetical protein